MRLVRVLVGVAALVWCAGAGIVAASPANAMSWSDRTADSTVDSTTDSTHEEARDSTTSDTFHYYAFVVDSTTGDTIPLDDPLGIDPVTGPTTPDAYRNYWVGACLEAVKRDESYFVRSHPDTLKYTIAGDTLPTRSVQVGRMCLAALNPSTIPQRDWLTLAQLYLTVGDDSSAQAIVNQRLAADENAVAGLRAETYGRLVKMYLAVRPVRQASALAALVTLDSLAEGGANRAVALQQLQAHAAMSGYAERLGDDVLLEREAKAVIAAADRISPTDRREFANLIFGGYTAQAEVAARTRTAEKEAAPIMKRALAMLAEVPGMPQAIIRRDSTLRLYGMQAPPLQAKYWFGGTSGDTIRPKAGKITLLIFDPQRKQMPAYRRISTLAPDGVDIIFVLSTSGYFRYLGPLEPNAEVEEIRKYYMDQLEAPATLAVSETEFIRLPDERKVALPTRNESVYGARIGVSILLVDRGGIIRRTFTRWEPWTERRIEETLQSLL